MALIGLVLLAAAATFGIDLAAQNFIDIDIVAFGRTYGTNVSAVFVAGAVTGLVATVGVLMIVDGVRHRRRVRAEARQAAAERNRLAAAYEAEHPRLEPAATRDGESIDLRETEREPEREHVRGADLSDHDRIVTY